MQKDPPTHCGALLSKPTSTLLFQAVEDKEQLGTLEL